MPSFSHTPTSNKYLLTCQPTQSGNPSHYLMQWQLLILSYSLASTNGKKIRETISKKNISIYPSILIGKNSVLGYQLLNDDEIVATTLNDDVQFIEESNEGPATSKVSHAQAK